ncbi:vacuolar sorting protein DID4 [Russula earlei]|uniref:Vacuolar sorting protein DID4 n=1 Tax=Russula earlei TaxID=71964 RepID=A0ACC0UF94_9AGAM|nr:vacuolar sorting protein DID4 [Russula earlei]
MNIVETLFGRTVTPAERLRQHQRSLAKAQRELDRERTKLEQSEKKLIMDIKKSAKAGQLNACKVMAKDLVRTRRYVQKFYQMRTQLQAVGLRIQTLRSNQQMADAMRGATRVSGRLSPLSPFELSLSLSLSRPISYLGADDDDDPVQAMKSMNRGLNLPQIQRIMNEFERESATMDMKEEMMGDAVDDVMDDDLEDEEEESDKIFKQILDEIGVGISQQLVDAPTGLATTSTISERQPVALADGPAPLAGTTSSGGASGGGNLTDEDALQARLDALRRG